MHILSVSHFFEGHGGGIERVAGHLSRQFVEAGHKACWAASAGDEAGVDTGQCLPLACLNPLERLTGLPMPVPGVAAARRLWREVGRSDAVIVHDALYLTSIMALLFARARRKPVVLIQHIAAIPFSSGAMRIAMALANRLVTRPMMRAADHLVFISDTVRRELLPDGQGIPFQLLFNGVDGRTFSPGPSDSGLKKRLGVPPDVSVALFVGRYVEKKGLTIIEAFARARPDVHVLMAGSGPLSPQAWALSNVHDLGPQASETLAALYRTANFLLLPSVGEGYPLVIQEAMACGLPVLCGAASAQADTGATRWLKGVDIDLSDPSASALRCIEAMEQLCPTEEMKAAMSAYALRTYSWKAMAHAILGAIKASAKRSA